MYEPREDSLMLAEQVKKYAKGVVLDIGTGSGIQAMTAAKLKKVVKVYAVDIDKEAVDYCKNNINDKKVVFLKSDLFKIFRVDKRFSNLKFDTIIFNPPYLPDDPKLKDLALDGGKEGYELICRFLNEAEKFLKPNTKILMVFSSLTGKEKLEKYLLKKRFRLIELNKQRIFFEELYVYLIDK
ncbi:methyltransferase [Candidatus Woesearchaeota archaeon]|nr:methyltransferase [Candidatus Woesearchaeota archaeon]